MLAPNTLLQDRYRILRLINQGNMGAVYLAEDTRLGNNVALKETFSTSSDALLREQFHREARLLSRLHHPSLPRVIDHFIEESGQFLVMDYIAGKDLMELLEENAGPFSVNTVLDWADQLLDVLTYLHAQDDPVVHRDIKPANIKLTPQGKVILLDFGLAKGATISMLMSLPAATMAYAPIEQVLMQGTDARSDLYSLGVTLDHLLTNTFPPLAVKRQESLWKRLPDPLLSARDVNAQVSDSIAKVLTEAMALATNDRPQTAARMRELPNEATRLSIAVDSDRAVRFKAQEVKRDSYENTLPFQADERSEERKPAADDLSDHDAIYVRGDSELAAETQRGETMPAPNPYLMDEEDLRAMKEETEKGRKTTERKNEEIKQTKRELEKLKAEKDNDALIENLRTRLAQIREEKTLIGRSIEMVGIPAGKFLMGSPDSEAGRESAEGPRHEVTVSSFDIGKYEVTQAEWGAVATKLGKGKG